MAGVLYDSGYNAATRARTQIVRDTESGLPLIIRMHDSQPILDANRRQAAAFNSHDVASRRHGVVHVARIPKPVYARLERMGITRDPKAFDAWLNDRDNRVFRVDDGRRL
jgi:hypothetical protein